MSMEGIMLDVIIIGAGPAGLSAAVYGKRAGLDIMVIEKSAVSGGQVLTTYEVDNYLGLPGISGFDLGTKFKEHAESLGTEFKETEVLGISDIAGGKLVETTDGKYETKSVVLATGAVHAKLMIPGEEELAGMGVSYCATCDGAFFRGREVAVIGGGDVAVEDAIFLARTCSKVYLIHRRDSLRAAKRLQDELMSLPNVEIIWNTTIDRINGEDQVESLEMVQVSTKEKKTLNCNGVFIAVGIHPNTEGLCMTAKQTENGYLIAGEDCRTSVTGLYAAGDVRKKPMRQIITAVADGANAINSILEDGNM